MQRREFIARTCSVLATAAAIAGILPEDRFGELEAVYLGDDGEMKPVATLGKGARNAFGVTLGNGGTLRLPRGAKVYGCTIYANKIEGHDIEMRNCDVIVENKPEKYLIDGNEGGSFSGSVNNCRFDFRYPGYFTGTVARIA